jgi:hypothetical protein
MSVDDLDVDCLTNYFYQPAPECSNPVEPVTQLLANNLSQSAAQDKLSANERRSTKRGRCLDNSCFCTKRHKRLPSESLSSVSHGRDRSGTNSLSNESVGYTNRIHDNRN